MVSYDRKTDKKIDEIDNDLEFYGKQFNDFCRNEIIMIHCIATYTPQQNGVAKQLNRTFLEKACCIPLNAGLSKEFQVETINLTCYHMNNSLSISINCRASEEV